MDATNTDARDAIAALVEEWAALRSLVDGLSDEQLAAASVLPGWSNADIVAHVIGTESLLAGRPVPDHDVAGRDHIRNPIGELNEKWLEELRGHDRAALLSGFDAITAERAAALAAMSDEELAAPAMTPAGPSTYGRFMRIRVFDCWIHELDLRDGLGLDPPTTARPAAIAVDEASASLPYVLAKRVGVPRGTTVVIELDGLVERAIGVEVAERASLVPVGSTPADVALAVDTCAFFRLIGGRRDADPSAVTVTGDAELGEQIATHLAYTI
ncbi:MAG TPA: maleylpyruvate isomerase family mycothiol-dependent enzyme [Gordonia sp. (in: high G+C Gram-positive bacteria)]|uniref:maleylpyruvate isomerase family mycothiol-dependent enzyme n=1 Tax=unclassified Gordonia (in: high G+C Gram-positive bacteria) TaxID=2657482 RepID=UPI000F91D198|nr:MULTISPECIES: maleylpyruvate isomerase family mycothiol-dependent enzyme [unclassified Gordonia (in: high G+C Gram-positive bacteria)]RUP41533.1 MAG: maleylpyruvate isomerase family mycothiol-dependent enzyme [Gordonia sp. (in: high G+C Gram-positive bacteria)]HNP56619.1 maleylpyruvate isomerase family mycothiol-dependent enzyme [Gordonia sp. (in: high G+C Gram-positive bacteria)]HRC50289.1 maleylpyruvate isomerase family mycothiol-dependent enzyme [Gordonia sp. (in: high G+C Gram-positive ba